MPTLWLSFNSVITELTGKIYKFPKLLLPFTLYLTTMKKYISCVFYLFIFLNCSAQIDTIPYAANTTKENRANEYRHLVNNSISKNLSLPLTDSTEENWEDAFYAMELINYRSPKVDAKIRSVFNSIEKRSPGFQRAYLELIYANYPKDFVPEISAFLKQTGNPKPFAMGSEYILMNDTQPSTISEVIKLTALKIVDTKDEKSSSILVSLFNRVIDIMIKRDKDFVSQKDLFSKDYLKGNVIVFSIQRKNRNYPGIAIVRSNTGDFIKDKKGNIFSVPQLARSMSNLPGYLTNGNTPQGIFRMYGFEVSKSSFIGPTENIQLTMPFETSLQHFLKDSSISDTLWTSELYKKLLPNSLKNHYPLYETFNASSAGRTEIIAHGTTVNTKYYYNKPYYPLTPTLGCLTSKEIWSTVDGKRIESDQQKLVNAVKAAGGANGYCIVIEIDDQQKPVSIAEILPYLTKKIK